MVDENVRTCSSDAHDTSTVGNTYEELRQQFRSFVNDDVLFRRFVELCNLKARRSGRLTFWQKELWNSFVRQNPNAASLNDAAILEAFHVCHIHMLTLHGVEIPIQKGLWDITNSPEYDARISREAPFSESSCLDSQAWGDATHVVVDRCDECFSERKRIEIEFGSSNS